MEENNSKRFQILPNEKYNKKHNNPVKDPVTSGTKLRLPVPLLKTVPGYYEPIFYWNEVSFIKEKNIKLVQTQLMETLKATWQKPAFNPAEAFWKGDQQLLSALQKNPLANIDAYVATLGSKPSWLVVKRTTAIQAAYTQGCPMLI